MGVGSDFVIQGSFVLESKFLPWTDEEDGKIAREFELVSGANGREESSPEEVVDDLCASCLLSSLEVPGRLGFLHAGRFELDDRPRTVLMNTGMWF